MKTKPLFFYLIGIKFAFRKLLYSIVDQGPSTVFYVITGLLRKSDKALRPVVPKATLSVQDKLQRYCDKNSRQP